MNVVEIIIDWVIIDKWVWFPHNNVWGLVKQKFLVRFLIDQDLISLSLLVMDE